MSEKRFKKGINLSCVDTETGKSYWYACNLCGLLNELSEEKDYLVAVIDKNLLKGEHEQSIKRKEAKDKMKKGESSEVSPILDVIFYWTGYIKALEELKEEVE